MSYQAAKKQVNGGAPPDDFLDELVAWGKIADNDIFAPNSNPNDVYLNVVGMLCPLGDLRNRRVVMLEVTRVLAGLESTGIGTKVRRAGR
jgi:hypothetical protein